MPIPSLHAFDDCQASAPRIYGHARSHDSAAPASSAQGLTISQHARSPVSCDKVRVSIGKFARSNSSKPSRVAPRTPRAPPHSPDNQCRQSNLDSTIVEDLELALAGEAEIVDPVDPFAPFDAEELEETMSTGPPAWWAVASAEIRGSLCEEVQSIKVEIKQRFEQVDQALAAHQSQIEVWRNTCNRALEMAQEARKTAAEVALNRCNGDVSSVGSFSPRSSYGRTSSSPIEHAEFLAKKRKTMVIGGWAPLSEGPQTQQDLTVVVKDLTARANADPSFDEHVIKIIQSGINRIQQWSFKIKHICFIEMESRSQFSLC